MAKELAPIATKVVFEDDYVRVWQQVVPAGGKIANTRTSTTTSS